MSKANKKDKQQTKTKLLWLYEGYAVLEEGGPSQLTIDELCRRLNLTKGSFYHHFKNRQDYILELLEFWEEDMTQRLIEMSQKEESPFKKLNRLAELATSLKHSSLEIVIRAWALQDKTIRSYQERVDKRRLNYLNELCANVYLDTKNSHLIAQAFYAMFIGAQQLSPPTHGENFQNLYTLLNKYLPKIDDIN